MGSTLMLALVMRALRCTCLLDPPGEHHIPYAMYHIPCSIYHRYIPYTICIYTYMICYISYTIRHILYVYIYICTDINHLPYARSRFWIRPGLWEVGRRAQDGSGRSQAAAGAGEAPLPLSLTLRLLGPSRVCGGSKGIVYMYLYTCKHIHVYVCI